MSDHNEEFEDCYYEKLEHLKCTLKETLKCDFSYVEKEIEDLLKMSFQQGVYCVNNQNGLDYDMEYPNE